MEPSRRKAPRRLLIAADALLVALVALAAFGVHAGLRGHVAALRAPPAPGELAMVAYMAAPVLLGSLVLFDLHTVFERVWSGVELFVALAKAQVVALTGLSVALFTSQYAVNRSLVGVFLALWFVALWVERWAIARYLAWRHREGQASEALLLVGAPCLAMQGVVDEARAQPLPPRVLGYAGPEGEGGFGVSRLGGVDALAELVAREAVDMVLVFEPTGDDEALARGLEACEAKGVPIGFHVGRPGLRGVARTATVLDRPFVVHEIAPKPAESLALKHAFDFVAALAGVIALTPLWLIVSLAIVATMGRPVIFLQDRAGLNGRKFRVVKFRTMVRDADAQKAALLAKNELGGPMFKMTNDPRITRLGGFLRKTSIDELPQLFNVLAGSMSLVGPRPLPIAEQQAITGWHQRRLSMRPGITGMWQINGRSNVPFERCMAYDLEYVDMWSLRRDLAILLKTIPVVLSRKGAK